MFQILYKIKLFDPVIHVKIMKGYFFLANKLFLMVKHGFPFRMPFYKGNNETALRDDLNVI
jgi:hypothetical protein